MTKKLFSKAIIKYIVLGVLPVILLTAYLVFLAPAAVNVGKPNTPNVLVSEKKSAINMTARNSWYITMLLRKVELACRMANEVASGVLKKQNLFFTQDDYKKIETDASGKFLTSTEKEGGALFICGGYKSLAKDAKIPVLGSYLDNTLALVEKNGAAVESVYIMTEAAVRKYPWAKSSDLVKTGLFKLGNYKIKAESLFANEDTSPYSLAGPRLNKNKQEIWTDAYWSAENKSWMLTYLAPLYVDGVYRGVLGADISLQNLLEKLIGRDQSKKFTYPDTFPTLITKNGILAASSIYGYDMLKIQAESTAQAELKNYGTENFKSALSGALLSKFWDNTTSDEELGGIEALSLNKTDYYMAHFPVRTGGLTLALFIPALNLEKSEAVSVTTIKSENKGVDLATLFAGLICAGLAVVLMALLERSTEQNVVHEGPHEEAISTKANGGAMKTEELAEAAFRQEKDILNSKVGELEKQLKSEKNRALQPVDLSKYITLEEYNLKLEMERKGFIGEMSELEKNLVVLEVKLKEANLDNGRLNEKLNEASKSQAPSGSEEQKRLGQRLSDVQKANDSVRVDFEQLKQDNEELIKKLRVMEQEGRNLAGMLVGKFDEEKKTYTERIEELNKQINVGAARVVELENKIKTDSVKLTQMDPSKFVPLNEVDTRLEIERKNYVLKIQELEGKLKNMQDSQKFVSPEKVEEYFIEAEKKGAEKIKELENLKLVLEQKNLLLVNENKKMQEALIFVEGRKKETDKQAQSLILKVGEHQQVHKDKIKELEAVADKMRAERDAAMRQYEKMKAELENAEKKERKFEVQIDRANVAERRPEKAESLPLKESVKEAGKETLEAPRLATEPKPSGSLKPVSSIFASPVTAKPSREHSEEELKNVLVVDDQGEIIKILGDSLYNMGFSVYIARNTKLARQKMTLGNYKNVILNVNLADGDYKDLFESIKKGDPKFAERIIFYSKDPAKDADFLAGRKLMKPSSTEPEIKELLS